VRLADHRQLVEVVHREERVEARLLGRDGPRGNAPEERGGGTSGYLNRGIWRPMCMRCMMDTSIIELVNDRPVHAISVGVAALWR